MERMRPVLIGLFLLLFACSGSEGRSGPADGGADGGPSDAGSSSVPLLDGFWIQVDGGGAAEGVVVFHVDGGRDWSPWGLRMKQAGIQFADSDCANYSLSGDELVAPAGPYPGTFIQEGGAVTFGYDVAADPALSQTVAENVDAVYGAFGSQDPVRVVFNMTGVPTSSGMRVSLVITYIDADSGAQLTSESRQIEVSRSSACIP